MTYICLHYVIRNGGEHITRKLEFNSKRELFVYMWKCIREHEEPVRLMWLRNRRKKDRRE